MSRESLYRRRRLKDPRRYRCTPWSGDTRNHATTRILVIDTHASARQRERIPHLSEMLTTIMMQGTHRTKVRNVELNRY